MKFSILMIVLNLLLTLTFGVLAIYLGTTAGRMAFAIVALGLSLVNFVIMWASIAFSDL